MVCKSALVIHDIREHPLAIFQAPGGTSNTLNLKCQRGLARGNLELTDVEGHEWPLGSDNLIEYALDCIHADWDLRGISMNTWHLTILEVQLPV